MTGKKILMILSMLQILNCVRTQTVDNTKNLLTKLFTTNSYNKRVRPVTDQSSPIYVYLDLTLIGIDDFDEVTQKLTTTGYLTLYWTDEQLVWNSTIYGGIRTLFLPQNEIWKPDVTLQNGKSDMKELGGSYLLVSVDDSGNVRWMPFHNFVTKCSVDVSYFPFDTQKCTINFVAWSSTSSEIVLIFDPSGIFLGEYEQNGEWELLSTSADQSNSASETSVVYSLSLSRRPSYFILTIIMPVILLGIINIFVFILPADSGEKTGFSVTVFLAFAVFLTIVSSSLPANSIKTSILSIYLIMQIVNSTLCVLLTIIQLRIFHTDSENPIPASLQKLVMIVWKIRCKRDKSQSSCFFKKSKIAEAAGPQQKPEEQYISKKRSDKSELNTLEKIDLNAENEKLDITWKTVCETLDFVFFWILLIVQIISLMCFFIIATKQLPYVQ